MYRIAIGPDQQPTTINLPRGVALGIMTDTYATEDDAQDALDALAETIEEHNPSVSAAAGLYALEINDVACYHIDGPQA